MPSSARTRCWYCAGPLDAAVPPEHVVPLAIGGTLTVNSVCGACNTRAGREVNQPLLEDFFLERVRLSLGVPDRRGGPPPRRRMPVTSDGGGPAVLDLTTREIGIKPHRSKIIDNQVTFSGGSEAQVLRSYERWRARRLRRGLPVPNEPPVLQRRLVQRVEGRRAIDPVIWARATTKALLACVSQVFDETWLDTPTAGRFREWLWAPPPARLDGSDPRVNVPRLVSAGDRDDPIGALCPPPDHLLMLMPRPPDHADFHMVVLGSWHTQVVFERHGQPPPWAAWRMEPHGPVQVAHPHTLIAEVVHLLYPDDEDDAPERTATA